MYTRFNLKRKKKRNLTFILVLFILVVVIFSILKIVSYTSNSKVAFKEDKLPKEKSVSYNYICIQTGVYTDADNAQEAFKTISPLGNPFTVTEDGNTRVLLGIYTKEQGEKIIQQMNEKSIPNSKFAYKITNEGLCSAEIGEIINANIVVLNRLCESDVKAVEVKDLKSWSKSLKAVDKKSKDFDTLDKLKKYISSLPDEITKDKANENYKFIYTILKKYCIK